MVESPALSKFAKWRRIFIGGLLSALVTGGLMISYANSNSIDSTFDFVLSFMTVGFYIPTIVVSGIINLESEAIGIALSALFWFLAGTTICYFIKTNKYAISCWFLLYLIIFSIGFAMGVFQQ